MPLHEPDPKPQRLSLNHGLVLRSITADAQEVGFAEIPYAERVLSRREKKIPTPLFSRGLSPAETQTGESSDLRLGLGCSTVFPEWKSSLWPFAKVSGSECACPDFRSKLILRLSGFRRYSLRVSFSEEPWKGKRLLFVNSQPESSFVSRGATAFDIF